MSCFYAVFWHLDSLAWIMNLFTGSIWILINLKISFMSSSDHPILTMKISVTNFCKFRYFADFDTKNFLLDQNSFEWIAFCWVLCILNLLWNFQICYHYHLPLIIILILFNWVLCKVLGKRYKVFHLWLTIRS